MPNFQKLSVIIPAYNKDTEVFKVVSSYIKVLKHLAFDWEIIVVDDASHDSTLREAVRSKKFNGNSDKVKIFSYNLNQGKGYALYHGFKQSTGDTIAFADADLDLPATNLPILLDYFEKSDSPVVIGSKRHPKSKVEYPISRRFMSFCHHILVKMLFNLNVSDTQLGLKVFKREVLETSFPRLVVKQFAFDLELLVVAQTQNFENIIEAPVTLNYNFSSTIHVSSIFKILMDTAAIFYRKNFLKYYIEPKNRFEIDSKSIAALQKTYI